jgi:hypothetical protein
VTISTHRSETTVADAQRIIGSLVAERQTLRTTGAPAERMEANRLALVYWQDRLSRALVAAHVRPQETRQEETS